MDIPEICVVSLLFQLTYCTYSAFGRFLHRPFALSVGLLLQHSAGVKILLSTNKCGLRLDVLCLAGFTIADRREHVPLLHWMLSVHVRTHK